MVTTACTTCYNVLKRTTVHREHPEERERINAFIEAGIVAKWRSRIFCTCFATTGVRSHPGKGTEASFRGCRWPLITAVWCWRPPARSPMMTRPPRVAGQADGCPGRNAGGLPPQERMLWCPNLAGRRPPPKSTQEMSTPSFILPRQPAPRQWSPTVPSAIYPGQTAGRDAQIPCRLRTYPGFLL